MKFPVSSTTCYWSSLIPNTSRRPQKSQPAHQVRPRARRTSCPELRHGSQRRGNGPGLGEGQRRPSHRRSPGLRVRFNHTEIDHDRRRGTISACSSGRGPKLLLIRAIGHAPVTEQIFAALDMVPVEIRLEAGRTSQVGSSIAGRSRSQVHKSLSIRATLTRKPTAAYDLHQCKRPLPARHHG